MLAAVVSCTLSATLVAIAALHLSWGIGVRWPANDEAGLVRTVVGIPGKRRMPSQGQTFAVTLALLAAALVPLLLAGSIVVPSTFRATTLLGAGCAAVFLLRGVLGYLPVWRRRLTAEPFATLDVRVYSPLCLALGAGYAWLLWKA